MPIRNRFIFRFLMGTLLAFFAVIGVAVIFLFLFGREFHEVRIEAQNYTIKGVASYGSDSNGPWVIFVHGNRKMGIAHSLYQTILDNLDESVSVLAIDMRGFGASSSEGMEEAEHILDRREDIAAATAWIRREFGVNEKQIILIGHSLGALQVLNAARNVNYGGVISIGPGAFELFVDDPKSHLAYIKKFERNTGVRLSSEFLIKDAQSLMLPGILSPCPSGKIVILHGAWEENMLNSRKDKIPAVCDTRIDWRSIPLSDHTYGTESRFIRPIGLLHSILARSLLMMQLNRSLLTIVNSKNQGRQGGRNAQESQDK